MFSKIAAILLSASMAAAHMEMKWPYPLRSRFDPQTTNIDYSMTNPLNSDGSNFPCKGYHKNTPWRATANFQAGQSYTMKLSGDTRHGGGSCQLSLSYDNGATFKVIESMVGGCPLVDDWNFQVPSDAPSGNALFAWTWYNLVGNRELYMNCADVNVTGGSGSTGSFAANYPDLWVANVGRGCTTVEGKHTVFPDPGKQVIYGSGLTASSPAYPKC